MAIVSWDQEVQISSGTEKDQELMIGILKLDTEKTGEKWEGKLVTKAQKNLPPEQYRVELRKQINGTNVLIVLGFSEVHKRSLASRWNNLSTDRNIQVSMNGKTHFLPEEMQEMNLAILEAQNVLLNAQSN